MIRTLYKAKIYIGTMLKATICTYMFRFRLYMNGVSYGKNIRTFNAIPQLVINRKATKVCFGNNVAFNNFNDAGWFSKCSFWVREGATLSVGDNSGFNGVLLYSANSITIGDNVKIGGGDSRI